MQQHSSRVVVRTKIGRSLYERPRRDGKHSYEADFTDPLNGRQRRKTLVAKNRTEARQAQADLLSKLGRGELVASTSRTLADVAEEWLAQLSVKPRTLENYEMHFRVSINPILGRRKIQSITPQDVALLITHLREVRKLSGWTSAGALQALNGAMTHAVWMGLIASNPVAQLPRAKRPKRDQREEHRFLSGDEIQALIEGMPRAYRPITYFAVWTGVRESEALGTVWGDVDLSGAKIHLTAQLSRPTRDRPSERVSLKTNKARSIEIDPELVAYLRAHREQQFALGFAKPTDYLFCTLPDGKPINFRNLTKAFSKAADRAGLNPEGKRKLRFHDLRRTHASILIEAWVSRSLRGSAAGAFGRRALQDLRGPFRFALAVRERFGGYQSRSKVQLVKPQPFSPGR